jgi:hypothetical protein
MRELPYVDHGIASRRSLATFTVAHEDSSNDRQLAQEFERTVVFISHTTSDPRLFVG